MNIKIKKTQLKNLNQSKKSLSLDVTPKVGGAGHHRTASHCITQHDDTLPCA
ncbi:hypothetical protein [Pseudoalteromonas luteoviolacea]|uniref:Uncharacterized protein n=1 Tax=Pseudoalteromonas luteoviolacea DSM 6061 TaxID=1365250 RepID=A0A166UEJ9_9GAMM|nr:hypothetical protein [Pseudoalteromonas luteoviolacea]KZN29936.1 hypothetical protein N475_24730 [Pseudoalteromonas luteoviolacea DSM 6061]KZN51828.1 hypothetical protein N474_03450 [Pseudoalteromonas luteoviolacea CPMOR-2]MBE0388276.1 hypothetical protein [Pseudoalteromonas luteoviolacea DSM 6061]